VTFSGGEPFAQAEGYAKLAKLLKEKGYEVASYSGYTFEQLLRGTPAQKALLENIDILIDGPFILAEKSLEVPFRGSRNQRILNVPASLSAGQAVPVAGGRWLGEY
jgi:anaerobic ribonucleoside-triphosphate reductase activating protein